MTDATFAPTWELYDANLTIQFSRISVGDVYNIWGLDQAGNAYQYFFGEWQQMPGQTFDFISAGSDATVIGLKESNDPAQNNQFFWFNSETLEWELMTSNKNIKYLYVGSEEYIWGIDKSTAYPCYWDGTNWVQAGEVRLRFVACGSDGTVWGVDGRQNVYTYDGSQWNLKANMGHKLLVFMGSDDYKLLTDHLGRAIVRLAETQDWTQIDNPKLIWADIGDDGTALGIGGNGALYVLNDTLSSSEKFQPQATPRRIPYSIFRRRLRHVKSFVMALSRGYMDDSITKWPADQPTAQSLFQTIHDNGFNAVLIGYAPNQDNAPNKMQLPDQRFAYDPVDLAASKNLKVIIDVQKYIKIGKEIQYTENVKQVINGLSVKTQNQEAILALHLYGEIDTEKRANSVNDVAEQIRVNDVAEQMPETQSYPTLAVAQEKSVRYLSNLSSVTIAGGNYDDPQDLQQGLLDDRTSRMSFHKVGINSQFWYLVFWIRDYAKYPNLSWRGVYGAIAMGARGIIWTQTRDIGDLFPNGQIKALAQYVKDINNKLAGAGLDNLTSPWWFYGKTTTTKPSDEGLKEWIQKRYIAPNPEGRDYYAGVFTEVGGQGKYLLLLLNPYNEPKTVLAKLSNELDRDNIQCLSVDNPNRKLSNDQVNSLAVTNLETTLPARGIVLLQLVKSV